MELVLPDPSTAGEPAVSMYAPRVFAQIGPGRGGFRAEAATNQVIGQRAPSSKEFRFTFERTFVGAPAHEAATESERDAAAQHVCRALQQLDGAVDGSLTARRRSTTARA